jgi:NADPH:quinone reductase
MTTTIRSLEMRSTITREGILDLRLVEATIDDPAPDEVVVRMEAAPINPTDIGLMFGPADLASVEGGEADGLPRLTARVPAAALSFLALRVDQPLAVGVEGAGTVIRAGARMGHLEDKKVAILGDGCFAQFRRARGVDCLVLPDGVTAAEGASALVNPLTVLGIVETLRRHGERAMVHTAAASNLGRMLVRLAAEDGIALVNVVRRPEQVAALQALGAEHVLDSSAPDFKDRLTDVVAQTGATTAFDAVGGKLTGRILLAMETAARRSASAYSRYGTSALKRVYVYGTLDPSPLEIWRGIGLTWSVSGWLLFDFLRESDATALARLHERVRSGLRTVFASESAAPISLADALRPEIVADYVRQRTGPKVLIDPRLDPS